MHMQQSIPSKSQDVCEIREFVLERSIILRFEKVCPVVWLMSVIQVTATL